LVSLDPRIGAFLSGNSKAGEELLLEMLPRVRNVTRSLLGRDDEVDDISQQVMMEVIRGLENYRGEGTLRSWVDRITVRVALGQARRTRARGAREVLSDPEQSEGAEVLNLRPVTSERYHEKRVAVGWLDRLPVEQRSAIVLHHILGFAVGEIAADHDISPETVRSRLRLGIQKLRRWNEGGQEVAK
jgi:RNA polymerase sigma-70 factor (ECF subfamily)